MLFFCSVLLYVKSKKVLFFDLDCIYFTILYKIENVLCRRQLFENGPYLLYNSKLFVFKGFDIDSTQ